MLIFEFYELIYHHKSNLSNYLLYHSVQNNDYKFKVGQEVVNVDSKYFRPSEVDILVGDPSKAKNELGWAPETSLNELVEDMMRSDLKLMQKELDLLNLGFTKKNYVFL